MRSRGRVDPLKVLGVLLALAGVVLGVTMVRRPGLVVPLTLEAIVLAGVTWAAFVRTRTGQERAALVRLFWVAFGLRAVIFLAVHFGFNPYFFAPDAFGYEESGRRISQAWVATGPAMDGPGSSGASLYAYMNAVVQYLFGESAYALSVLNLFAGVWTVLLTYRMGRRLFDHGIGMIAGVITAVFPSLVLWSVLNIRDSLTVFFVTLLVFAAVQSVRRLSLGRILLFVAGIATLAGFRDYMGFLTGTGLILGYFVVTRPGRIFRTMGIGVVTVAVLAFLAVQLDFLSRIDVASPLSTVQRLREGLQQGATSAFGLGQETLTVGEALRYLPVGLAFLLFAPFPWNLETTLQAAAAPETLVWYPLFILALYGMYAAQRQGDVENWIPISVLTVVVACYALVEGNFGTAYRHRAQIMPLFFLFSAVGLRRMKVYFTESRRSALARRTGTVRRRRGPA